MNWNYRIFRHKVVWNDKNQNEHVETSYGLHEVYYDEDGKITNWTKDPIIIADSVSELYFTLSRMKKDMDRSSEILDYEKKCKPKLAQIDS